MAYWTKASVGSGSTTAPQTADHLVSLERYVRDAFAQKQQAVGLFFDLEKGLGDHLAIWYHPGPT